MSFSVIGDASKAHRRIKVKPEDWGFQACRITDGEIWVNKVGTYGITSAGYFWSRLAAALIRLGYYLVGKRWSPELLIFADDFLMLASRAAEIIDLGVLIFIFICLDVPFKWAKFRGGFDVGWIGYQINFGCFRLGLSEARAAWLSGWLKKTVEQAKVDVQDLRGVLGRLCFTMGPLEFLRPFIAPLFAWASVVPKSGLQSLPWSVSFLMTYIAGEIEGDGRTVEVLPRGLDIGTVFRADAKAQGQFVSIGGWESRDGRSPRSARWYAIVLDRRNAPWAFSRGEPFRNIAALEMFATLVSIMAFADQWPAAGRGALRLSGITDNAGNTSVLSRLTTSKFPLVVILAEVAAQMKKRHMEMDLLWAPRNQNEEADALTNGEFAMFDSKLRIDIDIANLDFEVLPRLMAQAESLYEDIKKRRAVKKRGEEVQGREARRGGRARGLRHREPWQ